MKGKKAFASDDSSVAIIRPWRHGCHTYHGAELRGVAPGTTKIVMLLDGRRSFFETRVNVISNEIPLP